MSTGKSKDKSVSKPRPLKVDAEAASWPWSLRQAKRLRPSSQHRAGLVLDCLRVVGLRPLSISLKVA